MVPKILNAADMVLMVGKRFGMVDAVADREGLLEEVYRVVNKVGDTEPTHAICLADGRSFMADRGFDGNAGKRHLVQLGQLQMQRAVADDLYQAYQRLITTNRPQNQPAFVGAVGLHTLDELARRQYDITATAVMPTDGTAINWGSIEDTKISLMPNVPGAKPTSYLGFCVTEVGESYTVDNEIVIDIICRNP